jgi:hypothetical protein
VIWRPQEGCEYALFKLGLCWASKRIYETFEDDVREYHATNVNLVRYRRVPDIIADSGTPYK